MAQGVGERSQSGGCALVRARIQRAWLLSVAVALVGCEGARSEGDAGCPATPLENGAACTGYWTCSYGESQLCCGRRWPTYRCSCHDGRVSCLDTQVCSAVSNGLPEGEPCSDGERCEEVGTETCCGEVHPARHCYCLWGFFQCGFTDACLGLPPWGPCDGGPLPWDAGISLDAALDASDDAGGVPDDAGADGADGPAPACGAPTITDDPTQGRLRLQSDLLDLEFGYLTHPATNNNQSGGNLYRYVDKRYDAGRNLSALWNGGSGDTGAYASGAGGLGSTQLYAVDDLSQVTGGYADAISDNDFDGVLRETPGVTSLTDGSTRIVFRFGVENRTTSPAVRWYEVTKTWTVACSGRIGLQHDWTIVRGGYYSEPASRYQVSTAWTVISRFGHLWSEPPSGPPGSDSRASPANEWWDWTPDPTSIQQCNADGQGYDAVHAEFVRFHGGLPFDFWFWTDNGGLGYEGLGLYRIGYEALGGSLDSAIFEICHHNRALVGDGADAYNMCPAAWWGGDGAPANRYAYLAAGLTWTDSYLMEARPTGIGFPEPVP